MTPPIVVLTVWASGFVALLLLVVITYLRGERAERDRDRELVARIRRDRIGGTG